MGLAVIVLLVTLGGMGTATAQQLSISPKRVVLDQNQRSAELTLSNRGDEPATYRVVKTHKRMRRNGRLVPTDSPVAGLRFADDLVRYAPRQVRIGPGEAQRVRVMLRGTRELEPGEYRMRLAFKAVPNTHLAKRQSADDADGIAVSLDVVSSITIPLIVRHGRLNVRAQLDDLEVSETPPKSVSAQSARPTSKWLTFDLLRRGNRSIYGDVVVAWVPEEDAQPIIVGRLSGIAAYTEVKRRQVAVRITPPDGRSLDRGKLVVGFRQPKAEGRRVLAQEELEL